MRSVIFPALAICLIVGACPRAGAANNPESPPASTAATAATVPDYLIERGGGDRYQFKITYPLLMLEHPQLATTLVDFAQAERDRYIESVIADDLVANPETLPWMLTIDFVPVHQTEQLVVVAAEGYAYTGGAHGMPVLGRFTLFPSAQRMLAIEDWFSGGTVWEVFGAALRADLLAEAERSYRDIMAPDEVAAALVSKRDWIAEGATSNPDSYRIYQPELDAEGRIRALRVFFPPYEVGPYAEGIQSGEVPVSVFREHLRLEYRGLFAAEPD